MTSQKLVVFRAQFLTRSKRVFFDFLLISAGTLDVLIIPFNARKVDNISPDNPDLNRVWDRGDNVRQI